MIARTIRRGLLMAASSAAAQAAALDGETLAVEEGAASRGGEFETIAGGIGIGDNGFEEVPRFAIPCRRCEGVGEGAVADADKAVAPVPLPAGGALLLGGLAALGWVRRRR